MSGAKFRGIKKGKTFLIAFESDWQTCVSIVTLSSGSGDRVNKVLKVINLTMSHLTAEAAKNAEKYSFFYKYLSANSAFSAVKPEM